MTNKKITFICVGAQKAGTTTLHNILRQHSEIFLPQDKEIPFFHDDNIFQKGIEWWLKENYDNVKHEKYTIKSKSYKIGKQLGTTHCFACKDYTKNFRPEKVKMSNKVLREKSHCVVCRSNKSRFLKQKMN